MSSLKLINVVGFKQSSIDECVFYKGNIAHVPHTDDSILAGPCEEEIKKVIQEIRDANPNLVVQGDLQDFLGVRFHREPDRMISFAQLHSIDKILKDL